MVSLSSNLLKLLQFIVTRHESVAFFRRAFIVSSSHRILFEFSRAADGILLVTYADMKKSMLIATCLKNSGSPYNLLEIERSIEPAFKADFANLNYQQWNSEVPNDVAQNIIKQFGNSYRIDVRTFIADLI